jgi:hypothetical protein
MSNPGPWDDDPMWVPDVQPGEIPDEETPAKRVVRAHHFIICADVFDDGSYELRTDSDSYVNPDEPIWLVDEEVWVRPTDFEDVDNAIYRDIQKRLV